MITGLEAMDLMECKLAFLTMKEDHAYFNSLGI